ncbi:MAG: class I SAM-dependent methyltransferase [Pseudomonadales bacterium]
MGSSSKVSGSFRDPSGFVFQSEGIIYRQINSSYAENYDKLMQSGLYQRLIDEQLLIPHVEIDVNHAPGKDAYKVIRPDQIAYLSYPYEWCFSQLKDAALATLNIQQIALQFGMSLKDASGFNIQFHHGKAVLIDTLSFEAYVKDQAWIAYRQFCQHFLAPLLLISYRSYDLIKLLRTHIDGIPLELASRLLPRSTWLRYSIVSHIHLHARVQQRFADSAQEATSNSARQVKVSKLGLVGLLDGLQSMLRKLQWNPGQTEWGDYYADTNYQDESMQNKLDLVQDFVGRSEKTDQLVIDFGANTGRFSRVAMELGHTVVAQDVDEVAVEKCYQQSLSESETRLLPLVQDLSNPSPRLGWAHEERMSLLDRGPADTVLALALIHHLAIANNTPLAHCAAFFASCCDRLVIEFVPKSDSQVRRLLATREDIFPDYHKQGFEAAFLNYFELCACESIAESDRHLYLFNKIGAGQ